MKPSLVKGSKDFKRHRYHGAAIFLPESLIRASLPSCILSGARRHMHTTAHFLFGDITIYL
ncbi:MAG: hypothetical protein II539_05715 [Muribaculaceae bacterium]|nr:hypothetical protein [Muribaculaceae bacterium]